MEKNQTASGKVAQARRPDALRFKLLDDVMEAGHDRSCLSTGTERQSTSGCGTKKQPCAGAGS